MHLVNVFAVVTVLDSIRSMLAVRMGPFLVHLSLLVAKLLFYIRSRAYSQSMDQSRVSELNSIF